MNKKFRSVFLLWKNMAKSLAKNQLEVFSIAVIMLLVILISVGLSGVIVFLNLNTKKTFNEGNHNQIVFNFSPDGGGDLLPTRSNPLFTYTPAKDGVSGNISPEGGSDPKYGAYRNYNIAIELLRKEWDKGINAHISFRDDRVVQNPKSSELFKIIGIPYWFQDDSRLNKAYIPINNLVGKNEDLVGKYYSEESKTVDNFFGPKFKDSSTGTVPKEWNSWTNNDLIKNLFSIPYKNTSNRRIIDSPLLIDAAKDPKNINNDPGKSHWPMGSNQVLISKRYAKIHNIHIFNFKNSDGKVIDLKTSKLPFKTILELAKKEKSVVIINNVSYIVTGYGLNPDFIYPQFAQTNLTPNNDNQALIFITSESFSSYFNNHFNLSPNSLEQSIQLFISSAPTTIDPNSNLNNIPAAMNSETVSKALKISEKVAKEHNLESKNANSYKTTLVTNFPNMLGQRYTFGDTLANILKIVSIIFIILIGMVSIFILSIIIKKQVDYDAKKIGILKSLGYKATTISTMYIVTPFLSSLFSSFIGLGIGIISWFVLINIFGRYFNFYIQQKEAARLILNENAILIVISMLIPLIFIILFSLFITLRLVRRDTKELIYETEN